MKLAPQRAHASGSAGYAELLRQRDFALLLGGQTVSRLGDGLQIAALAWLTLQLGGAGAVTLTAFAASVPSLAFGLFGGVYADRWDRRRVMLFSDTARGLAVLIVPLAAAAGVLSVWQLALVAALLASFGTLGDPARTALLPALVRRDQLTAANALTGATLQASLWLGPAFLGLLLRFVAMKDVFTIDAGSFAVALFTTLLIYYRRPQAAAPRRRSVLAEAAEGLGAVRGDLLLWLPTVVFALGIVFAAGVRQVALPVLVRDRLHQNAQAFGLMLGAAGVGEVLGNVLIGRVAIHAQGTATTLGWLLLGLLRAPLGLVPAWQPGAALLFATGGVSALTDVPMISLMQQRSPEAQLGRVLALWRTLIYGSGAIAAPFVGALLSVLPVEAVFAVCGLLTAAIGGGGALVCWKKERGA